MCNVRGVAHDEPTKNYQPTYFYFYNQWLFSLCDLDSQLIDWVDDTK